MKRILKNWFKKEYWEDWLMYIMIRLFIPISIIFFLSLLIYTLYCAFTGQPVPNIEHTPGPVIIGNDLFIL